MIPYLGDFTEDATVYIAFNTFDSNDPSASVTITNLADGDLKVHKDGGTTQIVTDGATIAIDYDSITGNHLATIDTSAHADYAVGSDYHVRMEGTTVDGATINAWIGHFSIENRYNAAADDLANGTDGLGALKTLIDTVNTDLANGTDGLGALKTLIDAVQTTANNVETDTQDLQTQIGTDGAGLTNMPWNASWDTEVQSECTDALNAYDPPTRAELTTDIGTVVTDLDDIKGTGFVKDTHSLVDIEAYVDILDDGTSGNAKIATDVAAVLVDTGTTIPGTITTIDNELATVDSNVDAIKTETDKFVFTNANELDVNTKSINDAEVVGDGNATPWDGV